MNSPRLCLMLVGVILVAVVSPLEAFSPAFIGRATCSPSRGVVLEMSGRKKGKSVVPPRLRHDYSHEHSTREVRNEKIEPQKPGDDGLPVFNLFVRVKRRQVRTCVHENSSSRQTIIPSLTLSAPSSKDWNPAGSFTSDENSISLVESYRNGGEDSEDAKGQLDELVLQSLEEDFSNLEEMIFGAYPALRKDKDELEYGYKIAYENLSANQKKMTILSRS